MTQFASKGRAEIFEPGPPTGDYWFDQRYAAAMYAQEEAFTQHNEPNPILRLARNAVKDGALQDFIEGFMSNPPFPNEHPRVTHARKVLSRLKEEK